MLPKPSLSSHPAPHHGPGAVDIPGAADVDVAGVGDDHHHRVPHLMSRNPRLTPKKRRASKPRRIRQRLKLKQHRNRSEDPKWRQSNLLPDGQPRLRPFKALLRKSIRLLKLCANRSMKWKKSSKRSNSRSGRRTQTNTKSNNCGALCAISSIPEIETETGATHAKIVKTDFEIGVRSFSYLIAARHSPVFGSRMTALTFAGSPI
jgi:hypothetical protein